MNADLFYTAVYQFLRDHGASDLEMKRFPDVCPVAVSPENRLVVFLLTPEFQQPPNILPLWKDYNVVHLWLDQWIRKQEIIYSRLRAKLGETKRIHGRKTKVLRMDVAAARAFFDTHHLQGYTTAYYKYGLFLKDQLVAAALFSKGRRITRNKQEYISFELIRYASLNGFTVVGGFDKLIAHFIQNHEPGHLMTYADKDWSSGKSYIKLGFRLDDESPPQEFWLDPVSQERYYPARYLVLHPEISLPEQAGLIRIYNSGNLKFVKFCS